MLDRDRAREAETIGRYRVLRPLDDGGRHAVYLAEVPNSRRRVAVRVAREAIPRDAALECFVAAWEAAGRVEHPAIVRVHGVEEDAWLGPALVEDFVEGLPLSEAVRRGVLATEERFAALIQVAYALDAAHAAGVVHGNLRPSKILVGRDGGAKLTGFAPGCGQPLADGGDWAYRAPELLSGSPPGAASDDYALAMVALETLTRDLPLGDGRPSDDGLDALGPGVRAVFARALSSDPGARFPTATELLRALVAAAEMEESARSLLLGALPRTGAIPARRRPGRRGSRLALSAGLLFAALALAAGLGAVPPDLFGRPPEPEPLRLARVESEPPGATVLLDGVTLGATPRRAWVPAAARRLRIEKEGYRPVDVALESGPRGASVRAALEPVTPPAIRVARARTAAPPRRPPAGRRRTAQAEPPGPVPIPPLPGAAASAEPAGPPGGLLPLVGDWLRGSSR